VFFEERYLKTESFKTPKRDYNHRFGCPAPAKSLMWRFVKQFRKTGNVNIPNRVPQSAVVTETHTAEVSERQWKSTQVIA
jgi:hypothetical protein